MKKVNLFVYSILLCLNFTVTPTVNAQNRKIILLDKDWKFLTRDLKSSESFDINDLVWEAVNVPHDWAIRKNFDMNLDAQYVQVIEDGEKTQSLRTGRTGALPMFGVGWYCRVLPVSVVDKGKRVSIEFDGAMSLSKIYINGKLI